MRSAMNAVACRKWNCALRAPTAFSARIKDIRTENAVTIDNKNGAGFLLSDHRLRTDGSFIRAQSVMLRGQLLVRATSPLFCTSW
jgi:hypothetical protein